MTCVGTLVDGRWDARRTSMGADGVPTNLKHPGDDGGRRVAASASLESGTSIRVATESFPSSNRCSSTFAFVFLALNYVDLFHVVQHPYSCRHQNIS